MGSYVSKLKITRELGTDRTYVATWDFSQKHLDHFEVNWQYDAGDGLWLSSGVKQAKSIPGTKRQDSFNAPNNAMKIRVQVKGVSTKRTVNKKQEAYWKDSYCKFKELTIGTKVVRKPEKLCAYPYDGYSFTGIPIKMHPSLASTVYISVSLGTYVYIAGFIGVKYTGLTDGSGSNKKTYTWPDMYDGYEYEWQYKKSGVWFPGTKGDSGGEKIVTYQYQEGANEVRVRIRAVSKEYTSNDDGLNYKFFESEYSPWQSLAIKDAKPEIPKIDPYDCTNHNDNKKLDRIKMTLEQGSSTSILVTWKQYHDNVNEADDHVHHYEYMWQYKHTQQKKWIGGGSGQTSGSSSAYRNFSFTPPAQTKEVRVKVKPISGTYNKSGQSWSYWKTSWGDSTNWFTVSMSDFDATVKAADPVKIFDVSISRQKNVQNSLIAKWNWTNAHTDHYEYSWEYNTGDEYDTGDSVWIGDNDGQTDNDSTKYAVFGIPTGAKLVRFSVKPIASTYTDSHARELKYWKANSSSWATYKVTDPKSGLPTPAPVSKVTIGQVAGNRDSVYAAANWIPINMANATDSDMHVAEIKYTWGYFVEGTNRWFDGSEESTTMYSDFSITIPPHTIESNASKIRIKICPVSEKYTDQYADELEYWITSYSQWFEFDLADLDPPAPSNAPTVTINKTTLTATISNYTTKAADMVEFEIIQDNAKSIASGSSVTAVKSAYGYAELKYTIALGHIYTVRARGVKGKKLSEWTDFSSAVSTGPTTPDRIESCQAMSGNRVRLTWTYVDNAESQEIEYTKNLDFFDSSSATYKEETESNVSRWTVTNNLEPGYTWYFRVRAKNASGESGWTEPVSCVLAKTPQPPTTWSDTTILSLGEVVTLMWVHNAEDNSNEREATIRYFLSSDPETEHLEVITDETSEEDVSDQIHMFQFDTSSFSAGQDIYWSVKTLGAAADYSDYSTERKISVYESATVGFSVPEEMISYPLSFTASAAPPAQTAVSYNVRINSNETYETYDHAGNTIFVMAGQEVFSRFYDVSENTLDVSIMPQDVTLENNISYTITVTVVMDSGLVASASNDFTTALYSIEMRDPEAEVVLDEESFSASISPVLYDSDDEVATDTVLGVYRRNFDGTFTPIAIDIPNTGSVTVIDPHPALDFARYRITATSTLNGITTFNDLTGVPFSVAGMVIQWGDEWIEGEESDTVLEEPTFRGNMVHLPYNVNTTDSHDPDVAMVEYIGRSSPVSYFGTQLGVTSTWDTEIDAKDYDTLYALRRLSIYQGNAYVRESSGMGYWAHVKVSISKTHREVTIPVSFDITKVEGGI